MTPFTGTQAQLADDMERRADAAREQYNSTDWGSHKKRAGLIAKAQTWEAAAALVRSANITEEPTP